MLRSLVGSEMCIRDRHAVFSIKLVVGGQSTKMSLVDLAGSERAGRTQNQGAKLKEAAKINNSLMALGQCFEALRWNQAHPSNPKMVPFRNCKITRLFQELLSGNGCVAMVVNVNPRRDDIDETCHALRYASIASQIRLTPKVESTRHSAARSRAEQPESNPNHNDQAKVALIEELWGEIESLKQELLGTHEHSANLETEIREEVAGQMAERLMEMEEAYATRIADEQAAITHMYEAKIKAMQRHHAMEISALRQACALPDTELDMEEDEESIEADKENRVSVGSLSGMVVGSPGSTPRSSAKKRKSAALESQHAVSYTHLTLPTKRIV
eukprot:TRINITY_DN16570_c0_g1_i2.p1 TRINITY_DN16570_c0_g1~~TRINITY_DN16570_c0_g1_i2.p1  ORF type:complete len:357 (+),score=104.75 TRINITY_DN16570_c0_g1_i2:85-1071(+)